MKKINTIAAMVIALIFITGVSSCNKSVNLFLLIDDQTFCLPPSTIVLSNGHIKTFDFSMADVKNAFAKQGLTYDVNRIDKISVASFKVKYESGDAGNLNEFSGAQVYIKKVGEAGLGKQVAEANIPKTNNVEINLNVTGESLKPYLSDDKVIFTVTLFQQPGGNKDVCIKLTSGKISIKAKK